MSKNYIDVSVSTGKPTKVSVSTPANQQNVDVTRDTSAYNADISKQWATSQTLVLNEDYSSKYYANKSKSYAQNAENFEAASRETYDNIIARSEGIITEIEDLKEISEQEISVAVADGLTEINSKKNTVISDLEFVSEGEKDEIKDLVDAGKDEIQDLANLIKENAEDIASRTSFAMFDTILKDHVLTYEESKGLALQGTYVYKDAIAGSRYGYPDFYNKVVEEYENATTTSYIGSWIQPVLTSNTSSTDITLSDPKLSGGSASGAGTIVFGTSTVTSFADVYKGFDDNDSTYFQLNATKFGWTIFDITFATPKWIHSLYAKGTVVGGTACALVAAKLYNINNDQESELLGEQTTNNICNFEFAPVLTNKIRVCLQCDTDGASYRTRLTTLTIGAYNTELKQNANGHTFYDIAQKEQIDEIFASTGSAWMYGIDTENERIFLPRNNYFDQATGTVSEVGQSVEAGLPNIEGYFDTLGAWYSTNLATDGAFTTSGNSATSFGLTKGNGNDSRRKSFDASRSNSIYGNSDTVQPNAVKKLLYICVGNTVSDTSWVDVVTQVEGGVKDIEVAEEEAIARLKATSNALNQTQITNCLLEVPQNIKLELNEGVLTLKAGSKVIVPNGVGVFDEVVIEKDLVLNQTANGTCTLYCQPNGKKTIAYSGKPTSGETDPEAGKVAYNTTSNMVKRISTTGVESQLSFPIATIVMSDTTVTSIEETFNGMGYIGSTVWVDKGVKGLIPNGRNEDGSLNNTEFVTENIITRTMSGNVTRDAVLGLNSNSIGRLYFKDYSFDYEDNYIKNAATSAEWSYAIIGTYNDANGVISNFQPKQPIRLVSTDMVDGQWVYPNKSVSYLSWTTAGTKTIDLSGILPNNGYNYECLFGISFYATNQINVYIGTDLVPVTTDAPAWVYNQGSGKGNSGTIILAVGSGRQVQVNASAAPSGGTFHFAMLGYRRLGTNA